MSAHVPGPGFGASTSGSREACHGPRQQPGLAVTMQVYADLRMQTPSHRLRVHRTCNISRGTSYRYRGCPVNIIILSRARWRMRANAALYPEWLCCLEPGPVCSRTVGDR